MNHSRRSQCGVFQESAVYVRHLGEHAKSWKRASCEIFPKQNLQHIQQSIARIKETFFLTLDDSDFLQEATHHEMFNSLDESE
jgi:hypothetical protein